MQFRVLGPLEVDAGEGPLPLGGPKQRAVLATLLVRANQVVPADTLIGELWGDEPPEKARNTLQTYVSNLRRTLGDGRLEGRPPGYLLSVDPPELDAVRFEGLVRDAQKALSIDPSVAVAGFDDALALWRGPALAGLGDQPSLLAEAARLEERRVEAQEDRIEGLLASGEPRRAAGELETLLAQHPLRESLWAQLLLALYRDGRQAEALAAFQRAREVLADELGIDPSPELARLHERILRQDPSLERRGEPLRGYQLLERIGLGSAGPVFRAIQPHVGRDVAVEAIDERIASSEDFVRRFETDAQAVASLEHPHVVPVYDYWREPGRAYVVTRYLRGGSVEDRLERGPVPDAADALAIVERIAGALAAAHRRGVVHGAVGGAAVGFDGEGNAYLGGFRIGEVPPGGPADDVIAFVRLAGRLLGAGAPPAIADVLRRAELGSEPAVTADELVAAARSTLDPGLAPAPAASDVRNPFKGLRAFGEVDAGDFFGRSELIRRLVARLGEVGPASRFLAVVGPSGSGKSSVVRAGVLPAIRGGALGAEPPFVAELFPGQHPLDELGAALLRVSPRAIPRLDDRLRAGSRGLLETLDLAVPDGAELILLIDQLEEVFTMGADEAERLAFLEAIRVATADPASRLRVIATLRADLFDRPLAYPRFGDLLAERTEGVPPLTPDELEQAIRRPLEAAGVVPEPGLVAEMIADVVHQPGALPLLQYALTELFDRREGDRMTLDAYRAIGGVAGAVSVRADRLWDAADPAARRAIRQLFLRLVTLGEGRQDTRRRVPRRELDQLDVGEEPVAEALEAFGRHRLLTFDRDPATREPTVEIAHEALLTAWGRLRSWIDRARDDLRRERRLAHAAAEWLASDRDASYLLRGARLEQVEAWAGGTDLALARTERAYLKASLDERARERAAEDARRRHEAVVERRSRSRLRALVAVFAVAALVAGGLTIVATDRSQDAADQARIAGARELAAAAIASLDEDPELSVLLAMASVGRTRSVDGTVLYEAQDALRRAIGASRILLTIPDAGRVAAWMPDGTILTGDASGVVEFRDGATGRSLRSIDAHGAAVTGIAVNGDGSLLATTGEDGRLRVWDPTDGTWLYEWSGDGPARFPSFSVDGTRLVATWNPDGRARVSSVVVVDPLDGRVVRTVDALFDPATAALSPDGTRLAFLSLNAAGTWNLGRIVPVEPGEPGGRGPVVHFRPPMWVGTNAVTWSPDGRYLASNDSAYIWDATSGRRLFRQLRTANTATDAVWSPDGDRLAAGTPDGTVRVWSFTPGGAHDELQLPEPATALWTLAFSPEGSRILATDVDGVLRVWDVGPRGDAEVGHLPSATGSPAFVDPRRVLAVGSRSPVLWDLSSGRVRPVGPRFAEPVVDGFPPPLEISPDRTALATIENERVVSWGLGDADPTSVVAKDGWFETWFAGWRGDGPVIASLTDGGVMLRDGTGQVVMELDDPGFHVGGVTVSDDGRLAAVAGSYGSEEDGGRAMTKVWDLDRGRIVTEIDHASEYELFDPSGLRILMGGDRPEIWDVRTGRRLRTLPPQPGGVYSLAYAPDGSTVAVGADDDIVRLYDPETGQLLTSLRGHRCTVLDLSFSPDGSLLASSSCDGVRVWALDIDRLLDVARANVTRSLTTEECRTYLHLDACPDRGA